MSLEGIKSKIIDIIDGRFELQKNDHIKNELLSLADEDIKHKEILRIKRHGLLVDSWKTLVLIEIDAPECDAKIELKKSITWLSLVKESLLGNENTDLYLFLTFTREVSTEECRRIESTEQFCRKYVLMPNEDIPEFVNRTFLQKLVDTTHTPVGKDPLERAFLETAAKHSWLTPEIQKTWKKAFLDFTGNDLVEALLKEEELE